MHVRQRMYTWWHLGFISCLAATINYSANDYCGFMKKAQRPASDNFGFPRSIRRSIKDYCGFMKNARWRLLRLREDIFGDPAGDYFDPVAKLGNPPVTTSTTRWRIDDYTQYGQCLLVID